MFGGGTIGGLFCFLARAGYFIEAAAFVRSGCGSAWQSSFRERVNIGCGAWRRARGQNLSKSRDEKNSRNPTRGPSRDRDVGSALKQAYQGTLSEEIPDDLLDLLRKLD